VKGLRFTCLRGCTNCCRQRGFVYLTEEDVARAAALLGMDRRGFEERYVYRTRHMLRLRKPRGSQCPFLRPDGCGIHPAKPTQCRAFPFWPELLSGSEEWSEAAGYCPGIGRGPEVPVESILRAAGEMRRSYPGVYGAENRA
jgi:Fe-S-cluster containining protein